MRRVLAPAVMFAALYSAAVVAQASAADPQQLPDATFATTACREHVERSPESAQPRFSSVGSCIAYVNAGGELRWRITSFDNDLIEEWYVLASAHLLRVEAFNRTSCAAGTAVGGSFEGSFPDGTTYRLEVGPGEQASQVLPGGGVAVESWLVVHDLGGVPNPAQGGSPMHLVLQATTGGGTFAVACPEV